VIVQKATPLFKSRCQYIIKETVFVSSGETERTGLHAIGETQHGTAHLLLLENASDE